MLCISTKPLCVILNKYKTTCIWFHFQNRKLITMQSFNRSKSLHNCSTIKANGVLKSVQNELHCAVLYRCIINTYFSHFSFPMENDPYKKPLNPINAKKRFVHIYKNLQLHWPRVNSFLKIWVGMRLKWYSLNMLELNGLVVIWTNLD